MKSKVFRACSMILLGGLAAVLPLALLAATPANSTDTAPATGLRAELLRQMDDLQDKIVRLAEAVPADKYSWRPEEGVRSVSEVYMHIAAGNFGYPSLLGFAVPADINPRGLEKITDKAKVVEILKQSFAEARSAIEKTTDADLEKPIKLFGRDSTREAVLLQMVTHLHEHLGQSIAYARMNKIVPPWTAERQARQAQQKPKQ